MIHRYLPATKATANQSISCPIRPSTPNSPAQFAHPIHTLNLHAQFARLEAVRIVSGYANCFWTCELLLGV